VTKPSAAHLSLSKLSCEEAPAAPASVRPEPRPVALDASLCPDALTLASEAVLQAEACLDALRCYLPEEDELAGLPRGALAACGACAAEARRDVVDALANGWHHVDADAEDDSTWGELVDRLRRVAAGLRAIDATYGWGSAALPIEHEAAPRSHRVA
jgi:hypothetical protein